MNDFYLPVLLADFYKISHRPQYPKGTRFVYSTWIPRTSRIPGVEGVVAFGFQAFLARYLTDAFNSGFFDRSEKSVVSEYKRFIANTLGDPDPETDHIQALHRLGYLPLKIRAVPEGTVVPIGVPMVTIENTRPEFFWLTNFVETLFSTECWLPSTSATIARIYRKTLDFWAAKTSDNPTFVTFQGHDFSMRGMASVEAGAASGAGHLLSFKGTDTIPAILYAERYYAANTDSNLVGTSIPATEHSVMCSYGREDEVEAYRRLITEVHPTGMVSIVSDTWTLWKVIQTTLGGDLKDTILQRDGKVVVRPDSGTPVDILCGIPWSILQLRTDSVYGSTAIWQSIPLSNYSEPETKGVVELLWDIFGGTVNSKGYKELDPHIGVIYGDSITPERAELICSRLADKGFASTNVVYGIGSYTYQHQTRDTFGFALKSTWVTINGKEHFIYKDPATTQSHTKRSLVGRVNVATEDGVLVAHDHQTLATDVTDMLTPIFDGGVIVKTYNFEQVRNNLKASN